MRKKDKKQMLNAIKIHRKEKPRHGETTKEMKGRGKNHKRTILTKYRGKESKRDMSTRPPNTQYAQPSR
jgi:hypothetical protein